MSPAPACRRPLVVHVGDRRRACRRSGAGRRATGRARRPWPLPASRHWASDASAGVAEHRPRTRCRTIAADERRGEGDQQAGEAARRQVDQIVEARRRPAEIFVARGAVADHGVGGVDRLVGEEARQAEQQEPEGRRDDAVGEILRRRLDRGARRCAASSRLAGSRPTICATAARAASGTCGEASRRRGRGRRASGRR